jgi:glycosyltransferase involved in cell wall biosynthesis
MKIVCIATSRVPSDTANSIQVMKASQGLAQLGHAVHLLLPGAGHAPWEALAEHYGLSTPFEITWLPADPRFRRNDFAWAAVARARQLDAGLVYTWTGQSAVFGLLRRRPVLYEVHDLPTGRFGPAWFRAFLRLPGRKRLGITTRALRRALQQVYGNIAGRQVVIAPNGVDLEQYAGLPEPDQARSDLDLPRAPTVLCSGHLYAGRGVELFLELAKRHPTASFVWVGGRPEDVAAYRSQAAGAGLGNVRFTGFIAQQRLPCYQAAADILLMPYARAVAVSGGGNSADICSPMKMFDYLATGRAILASDLPVFHEVLNPDNAVFTPPEEIEAWAEDLRRLLADPGLRERLAAQARRDVHGYTWRARAGRLLAGFVA